MPADTSTAENTALLEQVFAQEPGKAAQELSINKSSAQRIFSESVKAIYSLTDFELCKRSMRKIMALVRKRANHSCTITKNTLSS